MNQAQPTGIDFSLVWSSGLASHVDRLFVPGVDLERDSFPGMMEETLRQLAPVGEITETFPAGELVEPYRASDRRQIPLDGFNRHYNRLNLTPRQGRFYPGGVLAGATEFVSGDIRPFRVIEVGKEWLTVDFNHPLAGYPLTIRASMAGQFAGHGQRGGASLDIAGMLTGRGPGMQARNGGEGIAVEFPLGRPDENEDALFYAMPRMVDHIDEKAVEILKSIYSRHVIRGCKVLDIMTSWTSHLDDSIADLSVTGIGMNREELDANPLLSERLLQDLNTNAVLPGDANSFDVVLCSLSVEYLTSPLDLFAEVHRVLKPGGLFINSFSERWFPTKAVTLWTEMHPFERIGMVLDYYIASGFDDLQTESVRGHPRPDGDRYRGMSPFSDPLYVVTGRKPAA